MMDQSKRNYFAAAIPHSARSISGERQSSKKYQTMVVLMRSNTSPLVVVGLCGKAKGENITIACFYVDFAAWEAVSHNMLGSLPKRVVSGLEGIPDEIR